MAKSNKDKHISKAQTFIKRGRVDNAIKEYQNALEVDKKDIRVLQKLGELYSRKNQKDEAISYLSKAAQYLYKDGFYSKAVALYSQILKIDEDQIEAVKSLGDCYMKLGLNAQAMAQFKKISSQYEKEGKLQEALDITQNMLDMDPRNHVLATKLAELYYKLGKKDEGYQSFMRALDQLREDGHYEQYVKLREKLIKIDPENVENFKELAPIYIDHEQWEKAYAVLTRIYKYEPEEIDYLTQLAKAALKVGRPEESANTWKEVARIYKTKGLRQKAKDSLRRVLEIKPDDPEALAVVGEEPTTLEEEDPQEVEEIIEEPLEVLEEDEEVSEPDEEVVIDSGTPLAEGEEETAELSENEIMEHLTEAGVYLKYGLKDKSLTHIKRVLKSDPQNIKARQLLKDIHVESGETAQAIKELDKISGLATSAGDTETAQKAVQEWLHLDPENAKAKEMMAEIEIAAGKEQKETAAAEIVAEEEDEKLEEPAAEEEISLEDEAASLEDEGAVAVEEDEEELSEPEEVAEEIEEEEEETIPLSDEVSPEAEAADEQSDEVVAVEDEKEEEEEVTAPPAQATETAIAEEEPALPEEDEFSEPDFIEVSMEEEPARPVEDKEEKKPAPAPPAEVSEPEPVQEKAEVPEKPPQPPSGASRDFSEELEEAEFYLQADLQEEAKKIYASILEKDPENETALRKLEELEGQEPEEAEEVIISEGEASVGFMEDSEAPQQDTTTPSPPEPPQAPEKPAQSSTPPMPEPPPPVQPQQPQVKELEPEQEPVIPEPPAQPEEQAATEPEAEAIAEPAPVPAAPAEEVEAAAEPEAEPGVMEAEAEIEPGAGPEVLGEAELADEEEIAAEQPRGEPAVPPPPAPPVIEPPPPPPAEDKFDLKKEIDESGKEEKFFFEPSAPPDSDLFSSEGEEEELFDLAAELEKDEDLYPETAGYGMDSASEEFSFEETLSAFKKGVAQTISEEDSSTHFDLAIAYKEMGLYDEAIHSFFTASGDPSKYSECMMLVAMIFREKGELDKAIQTTKAALASGNVREQDLAGLHAELGRSLKEKGEGAKALWALQKTKEIDADFPEVDALLEELQGITPEPVSFEAETESRSAGEEKPSASPPVDAGPPPTRDKTSWESAALKDSAKQETTEGEAEDESKKKKRKKISYV